MIENFHRSYTILDSILHAKLSRSLSFFRPKEFTGLGKEIVPKADMHVVPKGDLHVAIQYAKEIVAKAMAEAGPSGLMVDEKLASEVKALRKENEEIKRELAELRETIEKFAREHAIPMKASEKASPPKEEKDAAADDFDLFGSDEEEDAEKAKIVEERLKAYAEKKAKKPAGIAKSSVILDVKPWDDETNLKEMEDLVRGIEMDGLVWGGAKLLPIGYGINKLQIICVIEDEKVSVDDLIDKITGDFESHVQSVDIVAFNKI
ncbi:EF-1 guanine nucleotide exchange domain protein [Oesophagostomum dentatum]|uniref:EF-1 guanine nucleotide exchange domain protein n=1 Tax=Oesophagostomum dentatum TaxID=61180 RepID=A0A0B1TP14_OESDE|nr:EF-1 guanine nucleotide exchange domain protein [Oesophagostomum dentatum]